MLNVKYGRGGKILFISNFSHAKAGRQVLKWGWKRVEHTFGNGGFNVESGIVSVKAVKCFSVVNYRKNLTDDVGSGFVLF